MGRYIAEIKRSVEEMLNHRFGFEVPVHIISAKDLKDILAHAPAWCRDSREANHQDSKYGKIGYRKIDTLS